MGQIFRDIS